MNTAYLQALEFTFSVTAPVFLIVFLGLYLKRKQHINDEFIGIASALVFNICLPTLMFLSILNSGINLAEQARLAIFAALAAIISFYSFWWLSPLLTQDPQDRGVAVQSAFRSNLGIVGIALCAKAYGGPGLAVGALLLAVVTPIYNILSIYALTKSLRQNEKLQWHRLFLDIIKNPLIVSIACALIGLAMGWQLPAILDETGRYLGSMTLPLALITIGGSLSLSALKKASSLSAYTVFAKLVLLPAAVTLAAWWYGLSGVELGCLALMFASPTAAAGFVMVRAIGGNHQLASNTIALSMLGSAISISLLLYLLRLNALA
ncbi:AEC family transporter [Dasania sp. GY-MA-18]|uniref:AEC family transporter n=1 Tax=Dasania phycosphaerae TaxID=2950436 RepID=A0A9J6RLP5_9GAMM|nr:MULTISPECIES: AEC family transporter [Dasania]MCR8922933.1 AEC family transporter [Dasania sp. GY-MA-18]MCZ0865364.1 AEC family transporter [Dasania phycosphaerae]MCZ0869089.1 AEC family transporter [Dasania phycosphaerae]